MQHQKLGNEAPEYYLSSSIWPLLLAHHAWLLSLTEPWGKTWPDLFRQHDFLQCAALTTILKITLQENMLFSSRLEEKKRCSRWDSIRSLFPNTAVNSFLTWSWNSSSVGDSYKQLSTGKWKFAGFFSGTSRHEGNCCNTFLALPEYSAQSYTLQGYSPSTALLCN